MIRRPPRSTRTDTLFPYTTLFRSDPVGVILRQAEAVARRLLDRSDGGGVAARHQHVDEHVIGWDGVEAMLKQELADGFEHPPPLPLDPSIVRHARPQLALTHVSDGAGEGNRTLVVRLGSFCSAIRSEERRGGNECVSTCR